MNIIDKKLQSNHVLTVSHILCILLLQLAPNSEGSHIVRGCYLVQ